MCRTMMTNGASHTVVIYFILLCPRMFLLELTYLPFRFLLPQSGDATQCRGGTLANRRQKEREAKGEEISCTVNLTAGEFFLSN